jgi:hypothetical protein
MADTEADTEPAANQSGVDANEGTGKGNHCRHLVSAWLRIVWD